MKAQRLDQLLVQLAIAKSRAQAQSWIKQGQVQIFHHQWEMATKPSAKVLYDPSRPQDEQIKVEKNQQDRFASRAGFKLDQAFERVLKTGVELEGAIALDIGQSTGGFTDALLQLGCSDIVGVEVGRDQLAQHLVEDARVTTYEGVNARDLDSCPLLDHAPKGFDWLVMDVSFISQRLLWDELSPYLKPGGYALSLVKPQFELGPKALGKGGIVKDSDALRHLESTFRTFFDSRPFQVLDYFESAIQGGDGNTEYFILLRKV